MKEDVWKTPEQAVAMLGEDWEILEDRTQIVRRNAIGCVTSRRRIYNGAEHPLARPGMVVFAASDPFVRGSLT